jgi:hypothetical protein
LYFHEVARLHRLPGEKNQVLQGLLVKKKLKNPKKAGKQRDFFLSDLAALCYQWLTISFSGFLPL